MSSTPIILETKGLGIQFGGLKAVRDLDLHIQEGQIFGLIGPNGAGKTTVFNMLTGVYRPTTGSITAFGSSLVGKKTYEITSHGLARTFQNIRLFKDLTVAGNLQIALDRNPAQPKFNVLSSVFRLPKMEHQEELSAQHIDSLLKTFDLLPQRDELARNLPYGAQRRLEIARAMATGAKILLLDEPAAGMNSNETEELMNTIRTIRDRFGLSIFLIEHDMKLVMGICERIAVLDYGFKIAEGSAQEIQKNPKVIEAYLGTKAKGAPNA